MKTDHVCYDAHDMFNLHLVDLLISLKVRKHNHTRQLGCLSETAREGERFVKRSYPFSSDKSKLV